LGEFIDCLPGYMDVAHAGGRQRFANERALDYVTKPPRSGVVQAVPR